MKQKPRHKVSRKARAAHRQQLFLRAVVGSLVLCAAVSATPAAAAQGTTQPEGEAQPFQRIYVAAAGLVTDARTAQIARSRVAALTLPRFVSHAEPSPVVHNNMAVSANGKRLSLRLEMSREQAGNLLHRYVSLP